MMKRIYVIQLQQQQLTTDDGILMPSSDTFRCFKISKISLPFTDFSCYSLKKDRIPILSLLATGDYEFSVFYIIGQSGFSFTVFQERIFIKQKLGNVRLFPLFPVTQPSKSLCSFNQLLVSPVGHGSQLAFLFVPALIKSIYLTLLIDLYIIRVLRMKNIYELETILGQFQI